MTQGDKELLLKDLCCRLPYGVKAHIRYWSNWSHQYNEGVYTVKTVDPSMCYLYASSEQYSTEGTVGRDCDFEIKPYLFPLSSMTEEQQEEFDRIYADDMQVVACNLKNKLDGKPYETNLGHYRHIDWLNANHFDYRGLIPKGLAIDATGLNIY